HFVATPPPTLQLSSHISADGRPPGLLFAGTIDLSAMPGALADVVGRQLQPLSGPIVLKDNGATLHSIDLAAPIANQVDLGIATVAELSFNVRTELVHNVQRHTYSAIPYLELGAAIPFTAQGPAHQTPVSVHLTSLDDDIRFSADLTSALDAGLDEIKSLTN